MEFQICVIDCSVIEILRRSEIILQSNVATRTFGSFKLEEMFQLGSGHFHVILKWEKKSRMKFFKNFVKSLQTQTLKTVQTEFSKQSG